MKHISFKTLSEYADNRISQAECGKIELHLKECGKCEKMLLSIKNAYLAIGSLGKEELSKSFDLEFNRRLLDRIALKEKRSFSHIFNEFTKRLRDALVPPPMPVLARITALVLIGFSAYGILNYYLVQSPVLTFAKGNVSIYNQKEKRWLEGAKGYRLAKGDIVSVAGASFADIDSTGKYKIRVKDNSVMRIAKLAPIYVRGSAVYNVDKGRVLVWVEKGFKGSKFIIKTPEAIATAVGTMFAVDVPVQQNNMTKIGVLEGSLNVESIFRPKDAVGSRRVTVSGGEATEVYKEKVPMTPRELLDKEWAELVEFYQIGQKTQVALLISDGRNRTRQLLRPCAIYISDVEPRTVSESLEETIKIIDQAIKTKDTAKHLEGIKRLEDILSKYPNPNYEPQLLLFIGSYYNYLNMPQEAIRSFAEVYAKYPQSTFASIAIYAIGIIYEEKLSDKSEAGRYYDLVLEKYPGSPEAREIRRLSRK